MYLILAQIHGAKAVHALYHYQVVAMGTFAPLCLHPRDESTEG